LKPISNSFFKSFLERILKSNNPSITSEFVSNLTQRRSSGSPRQERRSRVSEAKRQRGRKGGEGLYSEFETHAIRAFEDEAMFENGLELRRSRVS
jgi:hypothetical protein